MSKEFWAVIAIIVAMVLAFAAVICLGVSGILVLKGN